MRLRDHFARQSFAVIVLGAWGALGSPAQTLTTLFSFDGKNGANPYAGLVQATSGDFYGTTVGGGAYGYGTVFKISGSGVLTTLHSFCSQPNCVDGAGPEAGLLQATNGDLYGTTVNGGAHSYGTVFKMTPGGTLTTVYNFCAQADCADGAEPLAALVQATNRVLYGTTRIGANNNGTIFKATPSGALTTLYSFCSQPGCADGQDPSGLILASGGSLYGATGSGGWGYGTIFKITPSGALTALFRFCANFNCDDGANPTGLIQAANGDFYGATVFGGLYSNGTVFKIAPGGKLKTLHSFCPQANCPDGSWPQALVQAANGLFYGTTYSGGAHGNGTIFEIRSDGALTTLYSFCSQPNCADGSKPVTGLVQARNGVLYGTTSSGGANGLGTVFSLR